MSLNLYAYTKYEVEYSKGIPTINCQQLIDWVGDAGILYSATDPLEDNFYLEIEALDFKRLLEQYESSTYRPMDMTEDMYEDLKYLYDSADKRDGWIRFTRF